jgi:hypothetical protein
MSSVAYHYKLTPVAVWKHLTTRYVRELGSAARSLKATTHAGEQGRRRGIELPTSFDLKRGWEIVEVTTDEAGNPTKALLRYPDYKPDQSLCMSVSLSGGIITVYLNQNNDTHRTLDTSKYEVFKFPG